MCIFEGRYTTRRSFRTLQRARFGFFEFPPFVMLHLQRVGCVLLVSVAFVATIEAVSKRRTASRGIVHVWRKMLCPGLAGCMAMGSAG